MPDNQIKLSSPETINSDTSPDQLLQLLLKIRQIDKVDIADFLSPPFPVFDHLSISKIITRLKIAIANKENILIYGDYDVDGLTATAILWTALYRLNANVTPFIPHRQDDGYGFKHQSFLDFEKKKKIKFDLIITVDNGISAGSEFKKIKNSEIIIIDHHIAPKILPKVSIIYHSTKFSASALVWFLTSQLDPKADLSLAALGTVADCFPLVDTNRHIVVHGLKQLNSHPCLGLSALIKTAALKTDNLSVYDLGFVIAPRLNAAGRLSDPTDSLRLLCSSTSAHADSYASILDKFNRQRQDMGKISHDIAEKLVKDCASKLFFVSDPSFHPGIIGLIAGKLTEKYSLPSIAISINGDIAKGSCRSIPEFNITLALRKCSSLLIDLGGHSQAAGFSLKTENIVKLKKKLILLADKKLAKYQPSSVPTADLTMKLSAVTIKNCQTIQKLQPFGIGNPQPLFYFANVKIVSQRVVGSTGDHLSLKLDDPTTPSVENTTCSAIAFKKGHLSSSLEVGSQISLIASLDLNTWNNSTTPQLIVKEILM